MTWTLPRTWTALEVPNATVMNSAVRDNMLELAPAKILAAGDMVAATGDKQLARIPAGRGGSALQVNPAANFPVFVDPPPEWRVDVWPYDGWVGQTNWSTRNNKGDLFHYGQTVSSSGAQNAEIYWYIVLGQGTWTLNLDLDLTTNNNVGIITVRLDDVDVATYDQYLQSNAAYGMRATIAGIAIASSGRKKFALKMATKHASSSSYYCRLAHASWLRTA
jgi:hypothetical protein